LRNAGLVGAVVLTIAVLLATGSDERPTSTRPSARGPVEEIETVASIDPVALYSPRLLDDVLVVAQPLADQGGVLVTIDVAAGTFERRVVPAADWPSDITEPTEVAEPGLPESEAGATSPDGTAIAMFTRTSGTRGTGLAIYTASTRVRQFHRLQSVGDLVSGRIVWAPDGGAVYFLAAAEDGSADRIIGVPVNGSPQTVASFRQRGFYGIAVQATP
jgi:hypothetical protein